MFGRWDDSIYYMEGDAKNKWKDLSSSNDASLIWRRNKPTPNLTRYNLTQFAITLNELTPGLKVDMMYKFVFGHLITLICF